MFLRMMRREFLPYLPMNQPEPNDELASEEALDVSGVIPPIALVEAAIFAAIEPVPSGQLELLLSAYPDAQDRLTEILLTLQKHYQNRGVELVQVASGWRFQIPKAITLGLEPLYQEKPKRLSRVILETLAIIAYRQPITRAEIEALRGVAVGAEVLKSLLDRQWICPLGPKEQPGRPMQYGTTQGFLDYFNVRSLDDLPALDAENPIPILDC